MVRADLLIHSAAWLLTMAGHSARPKLGAELADLGAVADGAVAALNGEIAAVGQTERVRAEVNLLPHARVYDAWGKLVMPCFVEPHTHLVFGGSRQAEFLLRLQGNSYLEIMQAGGGIASSVRATTAASDQELLESARRRLDQFARHGVGTVEVKSGYGLCLEQELRILRIVRDLDRIHPLDLAPTFMGAHAFPPAYRGREEEYVDLVVKEMIPRVAEEKLARFCDVFCDQGVFSADQARRILEAGKRHGLRPKIHADELTFIGGAELAAEVGAVSADHLLKASPAGIDALAEAGVIAVLLPGTAFFLNEEYAPAREMINRGVAVALSTDRNPGSSPTESTHLILTLACVKMKMMPAETLCAATINAAHAVGLAHRVGSLEKGKQADILVIDAPDSDYIPYHYGTNLVEAVYKKGVRIV
jgi:imidazolonepropionase